VGRASEKRTAQKKKASLTDSEKTEKWKRKGSGKIHRQRPQRTEKRTFQTSQKPFPLGLEETNQERGSGGGGGERPRHGPVSLALKKERLPRDL